MKRYLSAWSVISGTAREIEADRLRREERAYAAMSRRKALEREYQLSNPVTSGLLGDARLAGNRDTEARGLHDMRGLFLGSLNGRMIFYPEDGHLLTYGRTRSGKGRDVILPNLAHIRNQSVVVIDAKDGENAFASWKHRRETLGQDVVFLNPWGLQGLPDTPINPLQIVIDRAKRDGRLDDEARIVALTLIPKSATDQSGNAAFIKNARRWLAVIIKHLALAKRTQCNLTEVWRRVNCSDDDMRSHFAEMLASHDEGVKGEAASLFALFQEAPKTFEGIRLDLAEALSPYEPGGVLSASTSKTSFDLGQLKRKPTTVYLMVPTARLSAAAPWLALMVNTIIETIANQQGPVRSVMLLDEVAQLPPIPAVTKSLRLYAGKGVSLWFFCQGRFSLADSGYPPNVIKEIEDQAAVLQMWGVEEPSLLRDVEMWSGSKTVALRGMNHSGGAVESAGMGVSERARKVLQAEDIRAIGDGRQILKVAGIPSLIVADRVPYFKVDPWREQMNDVRRLHMGKLESPFDGKDFR